MTCQATYGNGVMIGMTEIITAIRLQATRLDQHQVLNAYAVVVAGTMTQDHTVSRTEVATRRHPQIDTLVLGCTHYPLLKEKIAKAAKNVHIIAQGELEAKSLKDYLKRHPEYTSQLSTGASCIYLTTENADRFSQSASNFLSAPISAEHIDL